jgi:hypothetical protein
MPEMATHHHFFLQVLRLGKTLAWGLFQVDQVPEHREWQQQWNGALWGNGIVQLIFRFVVQGCIVASKQTFRLKARNIFL